MILSQAELLLRIATLPEKERKWYKKVKPVWARPARPGEHIVTHSASGVETRNTAKPGDMLVENQTTAGEQYIVSRDVFDARYSPGGEWRGEFEIYIPKGVVEAICLSAENCERMKLPPRFHFIAPWGEEMLALQGDYLALSPDMGETYRIDREAFFETYAPLDTAAS